MQRPLHDGLETSADRVPDQIAIDAPSGTQTYAALFERGRAIAATIQTAGGGESGPVVAALVGRDLGAFEAIAGILMSGRGYVPLNPAFPSARIASMLRRSGATIVLADHAGMSLLPEVLGECPAVRGVVLPRHEATHQAVVELRQRYREVRFLNAEDLSTSGTWSRPQVDENSVAYLLFTSGSTGVPKGVPVAQRNIRRFLDVMQERYRITPSDRLSQMFDLVFDLSLFDIFMTWEAGARLCVPSRKDVLLPAGYISRNALTVWFSVPSAAQLMQRLRLLQPGAFPSLRLSLFCGEALPCTLAQDWADAAPASVVENLYGPTELTLACALYRWTGDASLGEHGMVPIGDPYPGMVALVVDDLLMEVDVGEVGELLMGGPQVALGYWNDPERTKDAFVTPPGREGTYYRTGDLVRRPHPGAPLVYLGRRDHQVKLQGHRVELGEIEAVLREIAGTEVIVLPHPVVDGAVRGLVAFVRGSEANPEVVRRRAAERLPAYMVPTRMEFLADLPLNANGKIDRGALRQHLEALG